MASINKIILLGNVGRDPEIRYTQAGEAIANFSLATSESWNDKSGQKQERTEWHRVEVFGKTADIVRQYVTKGKQLYIEGSIRYEEWQDKDGNKRNTTKVRVAGPSSRIVLLGGGRDKVESQDRTTTQQPDDFQVSDDDVPFSVLLPALLVGALTLIV